MLFSDREVCTGGGLRGQVNDASIQCARRISQTKQHFVCPIAGSEDPKTARHIIEQPRRRDATRTDERLRKQNASSRSVRYQGSRIESKNQILSNCRDDLLVYL